MQIHSDGAMITASSATADTFTTVATVRTRRDAVQILGAFVTAAPITTTAAESYTAQWRVTNNALSLSTIASGGLNEGGAAATNIGHRVQNPMWLPFKRGSSAKPVGQQDILIEMAYHVPSPTDVAAAGAWLVYTATGAGGAGIPVEIADAYRTNPVYIPGSLVYNWDSEAGADVATTAEIALTNLEVAQDATGIVGFRQSWADDVFGAEEHLGQIRYTSSIPNFEPQEWPLPSTGAPLGTAVGVGGWNPFGGVQFPLWFPKEGDEIATITPNVSWVAAVTTSNPTVTADVAFTKAGL